MSDDKDMRDIDVRLDADLKALRDAPPVFPEGLQARMLAAAYEEQPAPEPAGSPPQHARGGDLMRRLGGWLAAGALGASSAAGVAMGYAGPEVLPEIYDSALAIVAVDASAATGFEDPLEAFEMELEP